MSEQPQPPGQGGIEEPGQRAQQAASPGRVASIMEELTRRAEEKYGPGVTDAETASVATAPEPGKSKFGQIVDKLKGFKAPSIPKPHLPEISLPKISAPDLSGVREAALKNRITGILYSAGESYLSKFTPKDKDVKAWVGGILGGASSVIAVAEAGTTLGLSPVIRGIAVAATLNSADLLYSQLHKIYVGRALGGVASGLASYLKEGVDKGELRKQIMDLEKRVTAKKLTGQDFMDDYKNELSQLLAPHLQDATHLNEQDRQVITEQLVDRLVKLGRDYATVNKTAKSLAAGMSAGSLVGALGEVGIRSLLKGSVAQALLSQETIQLPRAEAPAPTTPTPTPTSTETITPTATQVTAGAAPLETATPTPATPPEAAPAPPPAATPEAPPAPQAGAQPPEAQPAVPSTVQEKIAAIDRSQQFLEEKAAAVGRVIDGRDRLVEEVLKQKGVMLTEIDSASFNKAKEAIQHVIEAKANEVYGEGLQAALSVDANASLDAVNQIADPKFVEVLSSPEFQSQLAETAQQATVEQLQTEQQLLDNVSNTLQGRPDLFQEVTVKPGETMGKILGLTWTAQDADVMGATIAANYDTLSNMWEQMAVNHPNLLTDSPFPTSISEVNDLVEKAKAGDELARRKLLKALRWIPAGAKIRILNPAGIGEVLKAAT